MVLHEVCGAVHVGTSSVFLQNGVDVQNAQSAAVPRQLDMQNVECPSRTH